MTFEIGPEGIVTRQSLTPPTDAERGVSENEVTSTPDEQSNTTHAENKIEPDIVTRYLSNTAVKSCKRLWITVWRVIVAVGVIIGIVVGTISLFQFFL